MSKNLEDCDQDVVEQISPSAAIGIPEHAQIHDASPSPEPRRQQLVGRKEPRERPLDGYSPAQRQFHWIIAGLVFLQLVLGLLIGTLPKHDVSVSLMGAHLIVGSAIFFIVLMRLQLRNRLGAPPPPTGTPVEAVALARVNHLGFYVLLLALPVFGWLAYGAHSATAVGFGSIHAALAIMLVIAIFAHLSGVIYHRYIRRDALLKRMTG